MKNTLFCKFGVLTLLITGSFYLVLEEAAFVHTEQRKHVLRLAENLPESNPVTISMRRFADLVETKTSGDVVVKVYAGAQLGQEAESVEQVRLGIIDFARTNTVVLTNISPNVGVLTLPYIFRDADHKYKVLDGEIGKRIRDDMKDVGLVGFDYLEAGDRSFYTRADKPIRSLTDMRGLKIRVQPAPITTRMVQLLGATPTPMNFGEVYSALQTGIVDGAENDYVTYLMSGHYEVAPNYVEDKHLSSPAILVMNRDKYDSLSVEHRTAIEVAAREAALFQRQHMMNANNDAKAKILDAGVNVFTVDAAPFREAMQPIYQEFPQYSALIESIRATE